VTLALSETELAAALERLESFLRRFVVFPNHHATVAVVLWIAHTFAVKHFDCSGYLAVTSADKRSGKTRLYECMALVVSKPWSAILPSEAIVFRKIDKDCPTLLLDEVDVIFGKEAANYEALRGILNAGNRRGVTVPRTVMEGQKARLVEFSVFSPKALAGIGRLPSTVADRSIPIRMKRRRRDGGEPIERFRFDDARAAADPIQKDLDKLLTRATQLRGARPTVPPALGDRAAEAWEPLLAVADLAQGQWPELARNAAEALSGDPDAADDRLSVRLLGDTRTLFKDPLRMSIRTTEMLKELKAIEEAPWLEYRKEGLTLHQLADFLDDFGLHSINVRRGGDVFKGYKRTQLEDAWARWLQPPKEEPEPEDEEAMEPNGQAHEDPLVAQVVKLFDAKLVT
jgi:hypothetical protein